MKYRLTDEAKTTEQGVVLRRIRALRDIPRWFVLEGDLGGWVEKEDNLSQDGDAWVVGNARVIGNARVYGNARVVENAMVGGNAVVCGNAVVRGDAWVGGDAWVDGDAVVDEGAWVDENTHVFGDAEVGGNARVLGYAEVSGGAKVGDDAMVSGNAVVCGEAQVCGYAEVCSSADYSVFKNTWSSYRWFTYTRSNKMWKAGCFYGTGEELVEKAYADSERSGRCYEAIVKAVETIESATAKEGGKNV